MDISRRHCIKALGVGLSIGYLSDLVAEQYPSRPIKIIVPSAAGGPVDVETRMIAVKLSPALGQPVIVDNRPGASNTIGMAAVAKAPPDGYTLGAGSTTPLAVAPAVMTSVPYDLIKDFQPITQTVRAGALLVVGAELKVSTLQELIDLAKSKPGKLTYGSIGPGGLAHVLGELFCKKTNTEILHVPYKAQAAMLTAIIGNEVNMGFDYPFTAAQHVKYGKLRALMVTGLTFRTSPNVLIRNYGAD